MEVIYLLGSVQAFFLSVLVFNKKQKSHADIVLGLWLAFIGLHILYYYLFTTGFSFRHPHLLGTGIAFPLLEAPFMLIYVMLIISRSGKFRAVYLLHGIPFLAVTLFFAFRFYHLSGPEKIEFYIQIYEELPRDVSIVLFPNIAMGPIYVIWSFFKLSQHSRNIAQRFSYTEQINLNWLKIIIGGLGFIFLIVIVSNILVRFPFLSVVAHEHLIYLAWTVVVFFMGYYGIKQQTIYRPDPQGIPSRPFTPAKKKKGSGNQYAHSGLKQDDAEKYESALRQYFKQEKPYLDGKLSLNDVAVHLDVTVNHLSQVINEQTGMSFFDFVNSYRVEEVKTKLSDPDFKNYTLLGIAYDSGFNSKSTFNTIFKKFTGFTPSQFASRHNS